MEETIKRALRLFLKNDYWREYYETAPDDLCRRYIELEFADSVTDIPEISEARRAMYDKLELQDWIHLEKYAGNNPFRSRCRSTIEKLSKESY